MSTTRHLFVIRHGETDYNKNGYVQGEGIDAALNEKGIAQANAFYDLYKEVPFDRVYTSKLRRARQSVQKFIDLGIPWEAYQGLNEINWGTREGIKTDPTENAYYMEMLQQWRSGRVDIKIEGGESPQDVFDRQSPVIEKFKSRTEDQYSLVCMHGRAIRILMCQLLGVDLSLMDDFEHKNLCLYQLDYTDDTFTVVKNCDIEHLSAIS